MFDILPNLFASLISILLPIFASYKALRTSDPALLSPWLMYWISFSLLTLVETHLWFVTFFIPFYAYLRIGALLYLVLPQTQGARVLYQEHVHPFLAHHEARIERAIGDAHERLRELGLDRLLWVLDMLKARITGGQQPPPPPSQRRSASSGYGAGYGGSGGSGSGGSSASSYAQNLLSRFSLPAANAGLAAPAGDLYGLLSAAATALQGRQQQQDVSTPAAVDDLVRSGGGLIPAHITGPGDRSRFVKDQREKLRVLLAALDEEGRRLEQEGLAYGDVADVAGTGGFGRSKSEASFERIDGVEGVEEEQQQHRRQRQGDGQEGWMGWAFGSKGKDTQGRSSGVDRM